MPITLITGVPGTGKTAFVVSELEKIAATGRIIFVDNIVGLKIEHYRAGKVTEWQAGTWLHIDKYKRTQSSFAPPRSVSGSSVESDTVDIQSVNEDDAGDGNENWIANPEVVKLDVEGKFVPMAEDGQLHRLLFDSHGNVSGTIPYESHKGALLVIDEAQRHYRPRPAGSAVPDHVAALEVHRHQGLDIWLVTQRPGLIDANVRALCGKHIALRSTPLGRFKYEWPEVGDIESKMSRDTAARTRYKLPKHVFNLYKSAEAHTKHKHALPFAAKALLAVIPIGLYLFYSSYKTISAKIHPSPVSQTQSPQSGSFSNSSGAVSVPVSPVNISHDWRLVGHYYSSSGFIFVLADSSGHTRFLFNPKSFKLSGFDSEVTLPDGSVVTNWGLLQNEKYPRSAP